MSSSSHVIYQQQLRLRLAGTEADGLALQRQAERALLHPSLLARLDALLTATQPAGTWLTLDRLELHLGNLTAADLEGQLPDRLLAALATQLATQLAAAEPPSPSEEGWPAPGQLGSQSAFVRPAGRLGTTQPASQFAPGRLAGQPGATAQAEAPAAQRQSVTEATLAAWLHFLRGGSLPPHWPPPPSLSTWESELEAHLLASPPGLAAAMRAALAESRVRERLVRQFSARLVAVTLGLLVPAIRPARARLSRALAALLRPDPAWAGLAPDDWAARLDPPGEALVCALLSQAARPAGSGPDWPALLQALAPAALAQAATRPAALAAAARLVGYPAPAAAAPVVAVVAPDSAKQDQPAEPASGPQSAPASLVSVGSPPLPAALPTPADPDSTLAALPTPAGAHPTSAPPAQRWPDGDPGAFGRPGGAAPAAEAAAEYLTNAGVILLHPFLPACFEACGWLSDARQFGSPEAREQAALLLHFLATGATRPPEYALRLARWLCGVPTGAPAPARRARLGRVARAEGLALLHAALAHWAALRDTTPDGLRTAFLQREGKLDLTHPGGPALTVAQQPQDVLLGRLPYGWGLGLVSLPWLPQPLLINWA